MFFEWLWTCYPTQYYWKSAFNNSVAYIEYILKINFVSLSFQDLQDNNYEEDFHSSSSDKTKKGQVSASGSEIEEEISSAGDDHTSISGGVSWFYLFIWFILWM